MRAYNTARNIFDILEFVAWVAVVGGLIFTFVGASAVIGFSGRSAGLLGAVPGLFFAFTGIMAVAIVQSSRANVDTAEMTGQMLKISKEQLQFVKTAQTASYAGSAAPAAAVIPSEASAATEEAKPAPAVVSEKSLKGQDKTNRVLASANPIYQYKIEHQGETIVLDRGKAVWRDQSFTTVDAAKEHVSNFKSSGRTEPIISAPDGQPQLTAHRSPPKGLS